jgi:HD-GYP domain-containing protein (c-di-GMP phosphodiesterase class II)
VLRMQQKGLSALTWSAATNGYASLVLDRLARQICQVVGSAGSSIFARDRTAPDTAIAVASYGGREEIVGSRFPGFDWFTGGAQGGSTRTTMPARWAGEVHGAISADAPAGRPFDARELEVLEELSVTAGAALEHAERRTHALRAVRKGVRDLVERIDTHDGYTAGHSSEVVGWACALGERLDLRLPDLLELELGALLHDLGKVRVPDAVLRKPGPLAPAERELVDRHPVWGAELLERVPGLEPVATIVRYHHERWDGRGYPDGLAYDRIPIASRIVAVCDAYQAMTSNRPYRAALPPAAAAFELRTGAGTQFDPALVDCFVEILQDRGWPLSPGDGPGEQGREFDGARAGAGAS